MNDFFDENTAGSAVCEDCGEMLSPDATFCPNCGSRRMSKHDIDDMELPFQYATPRIQSESYTSLEPEEEFTLSYEATNYDAEDLGAEEFVTEDFGGDYSDYLEAMNSSRASEQHPAAKRRSAVSSGRRAPALDEQEDSLADPESRKAAISVMIAAGFLALVLFVSLMGFIVSLFSDGGTVQTVTEETSSGSSTVSSAASPAETSSAPAEKPVVHLLPEEVKDDSYEKFSIENNKFNKAMASSYIEAKLTHGSTELAFDGNPETSWQDGVKGYGVGEWLLAYNSDGSAVKVSEVTVYNGYQNPKFNTAKKDMYLVNSRVSDFTLTFDDGTSESFTLEDSKEPQTFQFKARETSYIRFTVGGAYKGTKYKDTCIGEIIYK